MKKKELKKLRVASLDLLEKGIAQKEVYYIKPTMDEVLKYGAGIMHKSTRVVNHYRRMKRVMVRGKMSAEQAIATYKPAA
jgi:hypothetical protein